MAFQRTPLTDDNVFYHSQLGLARALELYIEAAGLDGRHKDLYNNLGVMLTGSGRQAAKLAAYQRAHAMPPDDAGIMSNLGNALREEGRMDEAKSLYDRAVAQTPASSEIIYMPGCSTVTTGSLRKPSLYSRKHSRCVRTHPHREVR